MFGMCGILDDPHILLLQERTDDKKKVFQLASGKRQYWNFKKASGKKQYWNFTKDSGRRQYWQFFLISQK